MNKNHIYRYAYDGDKYEVFDFVNTSAFDFYCKIADVQKIPSNWSQLFIKSNLQMQSDFSGLSLAPVFSHAATEVLRPFISKSVEIVPVNVENRRGVYYIVNVLDIVDCIDLAECEFDTNKDGSINWIYKYKFDFDKVYGKFIFRTPETKGLEVLVTEEFRQVVEAAKLKGIVFDEMLE